MQLKANKEKTKPGNIGYRGRWFLKSPHIHTIFNDIPEYSKEFPRKLLRSKITVALHNGIFAYQDGAYTLRNTVNNCRLTTDTPTTWKNTIYMIGTSVVACNWGPDWMTTASYLQRECSYHQPTRYRVVNMGVPGLGATIGSAHYLLQLLTLTLTPGDIVIVQDNDVDVEAGKDSRHSIGYIVRMDKIAKKHGARFIYQRYPRLKEILNPSDHEKTLAASPGYKELCDGCVDISCYTPCESYTEPPIIAFLRGVGIEALDLQPYVNRPHNLGEIFIDKTHIVYRGNALLAKVTYTHCIDNAVEPLSPVTDNDAWGDASEYDTLAFGHLQCTIAEKYAANPSIQEWLQNIKKPEFSKREDAKIGAIVMNCNPFTLGHLHIIETALQEVSGLFIFVVEEDRSVFSYAERLELVKAGVAHLGDRVFVTGSGEFIISSFSFPDYFTKETVLKEIDPSLDLLIFGSVIAPHFNIKTRFIGEEPFCMITNQYNAAMVKYLPRLGIEVRVIPRKTTDAHEGATPISASKVRALVQAGDFKGLKNYVPASTYNYLVSREKGSFPNTAQKAILVCCKPFIRLFAPLEYIIKFERDTSDFFASPNYFGYRFIVTLLACLGPKPEKTNFRMKEVKRFLDKLRG